MIDDNVKKSTKVAYYCKYAIITLLLQAIPLCAYPQFTSYSTDDNVWPAVYQVEDMDSYEIKTYNKWINNGISNWLILEYINAVRSQFNLEAAPATIIAFYFKVLKDTTKEMNGLNKIGLELINTTPKTIKNVTLRFSFKKDGEPLYDIKSGDSYCILKFSNLSGRTKSHQYEEVRKSVRHTYHTLNFRNAYYIKPIYNKNSTTATIESIHIVYSDGTTANTAALFDKGYNHQYNLLHDGPLAPLIQYQEKEVDFINDNSDEP